MKFHSHNASLKKVEKKQSLVYQSHTFLAFILLSLSLSLSLSFLSFFATVNCFDQIRFWIILVCPKFNFVKCSHGFCNGWSRERRIFDYFFLEEDKQKCIQSQNFFCQPKIWSVEHYVLVQVMRYVIFLNKVYAIVKCLSLFKICTADL